MRYERLANMVETILQIWSACVCVCIVYIVMIVVCQVGENWNVKFVVRSRHNNYYFPRSSERDRFGAQVLIVVRQPLRPTMFYSSKKFCN